MIKPAYRQVILEMVNKGVSLREISRILKVSRNTVRNVIKRGEAPESVRKTKYIEDIPVIRELFRECRGNIVRVREELESRHGITIPYQTLTWIIRNHDIGKNKGKNGQENMCLSLVKRCSMTLLLIISNLVGVK